MKTFIAQAVDASAVQQALSGLGTLAPLHLFPPDEQVGFERRAVISSRTDTDPDHGKLRSDFDIIRCLQHIPLKDKHCQKHNVLIPYSGVTILVAILYWSYNLD